MSGRIVYQPKMIDKAVNLAGDNEQLHGLFAAGDSLDDIRAQLMNAE